MSTFYDVLISADYFNFPVICGKIPMAREIDSSHGRIDLPQIPTVTFHGGMDIFPCITFNKDAGNRKHMFSSYKQNFELVVKNQIQNSCMNFNKYYEHNGISTTDATHANGFIVQKWKGSSAVCK